MTPPAGAGPFAPGQPAAADWGRRASCGAAVADWLGAVSLVAGALLSLAAAIGVLRFPDTLSRMHAATKPQVLGVLLLLLGLSLRLRTLSDLGMIALVGIFQLATAPVAAQMVGRAAYRSGRVDRRLLDVDELAEP